MRNQGGTKAIITNERGLPFLRGFMKRTRFNDATVHSQGTDTVWSLLWQTGREEWKEVGQVVITASAPAETHDLIDELFVLHCKKHTYG